MNGPMCYLIVFSSTALGALRLVGFKSMMFQGIAHITVGLLFGAGIWSSRTWRWVSLGFGIALTVLEIIAATVLDV